MLMRSAAIVMAAEYVAAGGAERPRRGRGALQRAGRAGRDARLLAHDARPQPPDAGQARRRRRGAAPLHGARGAALRRPVASDPHGRRDRAGPPGAARRRAVGAVPLAARPPPPRRRASPTRRSCRSWPPRRSSTRSQSTSGAPLLRERGPAALRRGGLLVGAAVGLAARRHGRRGVGGGHPVDGRDGARAQPAQLRPGRHRRGGGRRGDRQDHGRATRSPHGPPVPVPGVGGVQARAVGRLEAGARPHPRAHGRATSRHSTARSS